MTIQQLRYVIALDTHRQFVKAAESCFVTQPTLTLQVKKLEAEISTILFDRGSQPICPTPLGEVFIRKARNILKGVEELEQLVAEDRNQMEGEFRLGIIPTLAPNLLPLFIRDFLGRNPHTKLRIEELQSEDIINQLRNKELDLGLLATPLNESEIREIPLFYEPFLIYADTNHDLLSKESVSAEQLDSRDIWLLQKGHCFRNQMLNICGVSSSDQDRGLLMEGGSIETLKNIVQQVSGYTLIPQLAFHKAVDAPYVVSFRDPQPVREISLVVHQHFTKDRLLRELQSSVLRHIPPAFRQIPEIAPVTWR